MDTRNGDLAQSSIKYLRSLLSHYKILNNKLQIILTIGIQISPAISRRCRLRFDDKANLLISKTFRFPTLSLAMTSDDFHHPTFALAFENIPIEVCDERKLNTQLCPSEDRLAIMSRLSLSQQRASYRSREEVKIRRNC